MLPTLLLQHFCRTKSEWEHLREEKSKISNGRKGLYMEKKGILAQMFLSNCIIIINTVLKN